MQTCLSPQEAVSLPRQMKQKTMASTKYSRLVYVERKSSQSPMYIPARRTDLRASACLCRSPLFCVSVASAVALRLCAERPRWRGLLLGFVWLGWAPIGTLSAAFRRLRGHGLQSQLCSGCRCLHQRSHRVRALHPVHPKTIGKSTIKKLTLPERTTHTSRVSFSSESRLGPQVAGNWSINVVP